MKKVVTIEDALSLLIENDNSESVISFDHVEVYNFIEYLFEMTTSEITEELGKLEETYKPKEEYLWERILPPVKKEEPKKDIQKFKEGLARRKDVSVTHGTVNDAHSICFDCPLRRTREWVLDLLKDCGFKLLNSDINTEDGYVVYIFR